MKAALFHSHGDLDVLTYTDFSEPSPAPDEVLVKLKAAALNHLDLWVRRGWPGIRLEYPHIPGADGAGEVAALGSEVDRWVIGDRVVINPSIGCGQCENCVAGQDNLCYNWQMLGENRRGTYAEYVSVPAKNIYPLPDHCEEHIAAAAALSFQTAWHSLITRANLRPAQTVLIIGASGGVNTAAIQIAKFTGAIVYVVGSSTSKLGLAKSLGADHLIDRSIHEDWEKTIYSMTDKRGVDIVVDNVGTTFPRSFRAVRKGGSILTVGNTGGAKFEIDNRYIFGKQLTLVGSSMGTYQDFATVMDLVFSGALKPVIDKRFPLSEARAAQERLEQGRQMGKIILDIDQRVVDLGTFHGPQN